MKQVKCKSGLTGWQSKLQKVYTTFEEFLSYCETYAIHTRLGFKHPINLWTKNPIIQGSVNPSDLKIIVK